MDTFFEALKYILPAIVVMVTALWLALYFLKQENWRITHVQKSKNSVMLIKIRLQAYERILLFLERIRPEQIVIRISNPELTAPNLQQLLLGSIREEYEHNLVQQLYVSEEAWQKVNQARGWVVKLINEAAAKQHSNSGGNELAINIIEMAMLAGEKDINSAVKILKKEVQKLF